MGPLVNPIKDREFSNPTINYKFILIFLRKIIKNVEYKKNMSRPFKFFSFLSNYYNQFQILILKILSPPSLYDYDGVYGFDNTFRYPKFRRWLHLSGLWSRICPTNKSGLRCRNYRKKSGLDYQHFGTGSDLTLQIHIHHYHKSHQIQTTILDETSRRWIIEFEHLHHKLVIIINS